MNKLLNIINKAKNFLTNNDFKIGYNRRIPVLKLEKFAVDGIIKDTEKYSHFERGITQRLAAQLYDNDILNMVKYGESLYSYQVGIMINHFMCSFYTIQELNENSTPEDLLKIIKKRAGEEE